MRDVLRVGSTCLVSLSLLACAQPGGRVPAADVPQSAAAAVTAVAAASAPTTAREQMSYSLGVQTARNLIRSEVRFDVEQIIQGLRDAAAGNRTAMGEKEMRMSVASMQADIQRKLAADRVGLATRNRQKGDAFAAEYRQRPGVQALPSKVLLRELKPGRGGARPSEESVVRVAYRGTLLDGSEFDATEAGKSTTMDVAQLIPGWREALRHMTPGASYEVVIPPHMGYGDKGVGGSIGPNETLVFTVDLIDILR